MEIKSLVYIVAAVIVAYLIYHYVIRSTDDVTFTSVEPATRDTPIIINGADLQGGMTNDYTVSVWVYINDWGKNLGDSKVVFQRVGNDVEGDATQKLMYPRMELGKYLNTATFMIAQEGTTDGEGKSNFECSVEGIPLQKWTNVIMSINNRAVDIYLDGKLVKTCVMTGVADQAVLDTPMVISPKDTATSATQFDGYTSRFRYINHAITPADAFAIYRRGYQPLSISSFLRYGVRFSLTENNKEVSSINI